MKTKETSRADGFESPSGRTRVSVFTEENGSGLITVEQDGHTIHRFDIPAEQAGVDGPPKTG